MKSINSAVKSTNNTNNIFATAMAKATANCKAYADADAKADVKVAKAADARIKILQKDTLFSLAYTAGGQMVIADGDLEGNLTEPMMATRQLEDGTQLTAEAGAIMAVYSKLTSDLANSKKKHLVYYTNNYAVLRLAGMWKRAMAGEEEALTDGQLSHIAEDLNRYGEAYVAICSTCFDAMKQAHAAGKVLSFQDKGVVDIDRATKQVHGFYTLRYAVRDTAAAGHKVQMKNGFGTLTLAGKTIKVQAFSRLTGSYKLVLTPSGDIAIEHKLDGSTTGAQVKAFVGEMYKAAFIKLGTMMKTESADKVLEEADGLDDLLSA